MSVPVDHNRIWSRVIFSTESKRLSERWCANSKQVTTPFYKGKEGKGHAA
jgi:hypothetical protein